MEDFLSKNYVIPIPPSDYMNYRDGANPFRILSSAITGYEYFNTDNKSVRSKTQFNDIPTDIKVGKDGKIKISHFWAFVVWNPQAEEFKDELGNRTYKGRIQILKVTQSTIQRAMKIKIDNRKGDAKGYDFIITKTGDGLDTEYDVDVSDNSPINPEIEAAYNAKSVNLEALYEGKDPFSH